MGELKRRVGEGQNEYIARVYKYKTEYGLTNKDCCKVINKELNSNYAESTLRGIAYPFTEGYELGFERALSEKELMNELEELEQKKLELEKEKFKFQDQKREYRALLRTDARFEHLKDEMLKAIGELNTTKPMINKYNGTTDTSNHEAVIQLSDWHYGIEDKNYWNEINIEILKQRVSELKDKTIEYCLLHKVNTVHVELLGDLVNGYLHLGTRVSNEEDVISQVMGVSELIAEFLNELAMYIPKIKVYSTLSNHGRCTANKKESIEIENFERLIPWYLNGRLENNVEICDTLFENEEEIVVYKFLNEIIVMCHGHNDKVGQAITKLSKMFKVFFTECHLGHYHSYKEFDEYDMTTTVNGTLSGTDKYAKTIRVCGRPSQTLMIYNEKGRLCTYKIKF